MSCAREDEGKKSALHNKQNTRTLVALIIFPEIARFMVFLRIAPRNSQKRQSLSKQNLVCRRQSRYCVSREQQSVEAKWHTIAGIFKIDATS